MSRAAPWQRWIGVPLALILAVAMQASLFAWVPLLGAKPELALLVAVGAGLYAGPEWGAGTGFFGGLLVDLNGVLPLGITALSFCIVGYVVGVISLQGAEEDRGLLVPLAIAGGATLLGEILVLLFGYLLNQGTRGVTVGIVLLTAVYNTVLATGVLPAMRRLLTGRGNA